MHTNPKKIALIGGDLRQVCLANLLVKRNISNEVTCLFLDKDVEFDKHIAITNAYQTVLSQSDIIIMGLPVTVDGIHISAPFSDEKVAIERIFQSINKDAFVLGGMVNDKINAVAKSHGITIHDYFAREELVVLNAIPTAEGALEIAMHEIPTTIFGSNCMITGFGRIGKALAKLLIGCGANVTVAARSYEDLAHAKICGCKTVLLSEFENWLGDVDVLFNTIPAMIMNEICLNKIKKSALIIDLASKPGGIDFETAKKLGLNVIWALSLPGKVAPVTAGQIILDTIINMLNEKGTYI